MIKTTFQENTNDCGIACLVMIASHYKHVTTVQKLSALINNNSAALSAQDIIFLAETLGFDSRVLRLEPEEISELKTPCMLHWKMNHFVVLESISCGRYNIVDPSRGRRKASLSEINNFFTGVAVEFTPTAAFHPKKTPAEISLTSLAKGLIVETPTFTYVVIMVAILEAITLLVPLVSQLVIDGAITSHDKDFLLVAVVGGVCLVMFQFTVGVAGDVAKLKLSQRVSLRWSTNLFGHLMTLPWSYFQSRQVGDISSRFSALKPIREFLLTSIITFWVDLAVLLITCVLMVTYSPALFWIVSAACFSYALTQLVSFPFLKNATAERVALSSTEHAYFLESLRSALTIKMSGNIAGRTNHWANRVVDVQNRDTATQKIHIIISAANTLIFGIESMFVLYVAGSLIMESQMSIGMLVAFMGFKGNFSTRFSRLIDMTIQWNMQSVYCNRLADIALQEPEHQHARQHFTFEAPITIEMINVSFRHSIQAPWVLKDINLTIPPGESLAIVGRSGSGKSTLAKLIVGLLHPTEGYILINGVRMDECGIANMRTFIGTVLQEDQVLNGTVAENIAGFDLEPCITKIKDASNNANLHNIICKLPMGYHTPITNNCSTLSSGQKQRLYLARALYKQPKLLVLDEATSNLDLHSEQHVISVLKQLPATIITIAHRKETLTIASKIIQLEKGKIIIP